MTPNARDADASSSTDATSTTSQQSPSSTTAQRILKRAEVSRITRLLKHRLEIAQYKVERKWQHFSLKSVAPQLEQEVLLASQSRQQQQQNQALTNGNGLSMSESSVTPPPSSMGAATAHESFSGASGRSGPPAASPPRSADDPFLIPDLPIRSRFQESSVRNGDANGPALYAHSYAPSQQNTTAGFQVSPRKRPRAPSDEEGESDASHMSPLKYRAATPSMQRRSSHGHSGSEGPHPPRTPPPSTPPPLYRTALASSSRTAGKSQRQGQPNNAASFKDSEEGADLLLYLATSPSPAKARRSRDFLPQPSPRSSGSHAHHGQTMYPGGPFSSPPPVMRGSSQVNTPVGGGFNLSEFLNFTPSPAQAAAAHHPGLHLQTASGQTISGRLAAAAAASAGSSSANRYGHVGDVKVSPIKLTYDAATRASPSRNATAARLYGSSREEVASSGYLEAALGSPSRRTGATTSGTGVSHRGSTTTMARPARLDFV
ncbi:hypothetical protein BCR37DRAFT_378434 [Protomyces lactucae-debilis]|uniref:Uncharacterized protein n=1 Tax=Protomyces lactucae-debilis TaxID=2754530 RepID=A0A1Y2FKF1_PROLT|nr:uncharacterized protein BCR37DRAFT_378434 [Protomyces lactucae-debilis]ORY84409.1 hypothetical protein BCR37DRAFT_378434 [Protomyces lactucae-debilis]